MRKKARAAGQNAEKNANSQALLLKEKALTRYVQRRYTTYTTSLY